MKTLLVLMALSTGADIWTLNNSDINFKEGGVTKAQIKAGGFFKPVELPTASLPGTCYNGAIVWDTTVESLKVCAGNAWSAIGGSSPGGGLTHPQVMVRSANVFGSF